MNKGTRPPRGRCLEVPLQQLSRRPQRLLFPRDLQIPGAGRGAHLRVPLRVHRSPLRARRPPGRGGCHPEAADHNRPGRGLHRGLRRGRPGLRPDTLLQDTEALRVVQGDGLQAREAPRAAEGGHILLPLRDSCLTKTTDGSNAV
ncbi:protransforming growth factor alpha isoform X3 [Erythrolamprus reginae]|uniref:protransforming growth factor alpha isoform X3 n=1 Tax=Erythrolamprus reginae TaxID=121349 RepID=UPI00396CFDB7